MENTKNNSLITILLTIFIILSVELGGFIIYDKFLSENNIEDNKPGQNDTNINDNNDSFSIDNTRLEEAIKNALVGKTEFTVSDLKYYNQTYKEAEGHRTLKVELKDNKIYAYINARIAMYHKENGVYKETSGMAGPYVLIFSKDYHFLGYMQPGDGEIYGKTLKEIFPNDLIEKLSESYNTDFYQKQINEYLK